MTTGYNFTFIPQLIQVFEAVYLRNRYRERNQSYQGIFIACLASNFH